MTSRFKVILIGPSTTGKTSIIRRYTQNDFLEAHFITPLPVQNTARIDGPDCVLAIWDTAGSEDWQSMNTTVYHGSDAVIFVGSFDRKESLDDLVTTWKPRVLEHLALDSVVHVLAVNKSDLMEEGEVTQSDIDRRAAELDPGMRSMNVSAKNNVGITELFKYVANELTKKTKHNESEPVHVSTANESEPVHLSTANESGTRPQSRSECC
jgi:small GTP-binding protein